MSALSHATKSIRLIVDHSEVIVGRIDKHLTSLPHVCSSSLIIPFGKRYRAGRLVVSRANVYVLHLLSVVFFSFCCHG